MPTHTRPSVTPQFVLGVFITLAGIVLMLDRLMVDQDPSSVLVHGGGVAASIAATVAFWRRIPVVHMQAGMIEAAWDLMNTNRHIKIFATIREEAFASYESDIKTNLYGATSALRSAGFTVTDRTVDGVLCLTATPDR